MRQYDFQLIGQTPILIHADDVVASDELKEWRTAPENREMSVAGDDRSPGWTWQTYLYHDGEHLAAPQENIMACIREAARRIPRGRGSNFKALSQVGLLIGSDFCDLRAGGKKVPVAGFVAIRNLPFMGQLKAVRDMGYDLKVKRAKVGTSKHVRVRLMLKNWSISGSIMVSEAAITDKVLEQIFEIAGRYVGLFDWRPGSPKSPGPYGIFKAKLSLTADLAAA